MSSQTGKPFDEFIAHLVKQVFGKSLAGIAP
jgi:hypothetical protein